MGVKANVPYLKPFIQPQVAAQTEWAVTAPGQGLWRVISVHFSLATDATASNRSVGLFMDDGSDTYFRTVAASVQTASLTWSYCAFQGAGQSDSTGNQNFMPLPGDGLWLQPGWRLRSSTDNFQAGDRYSAVNVLVEEFPNGPSREWAPTIPRAEYERS